MSDYDDEDVYDYQPFSKSSYDDASADFREVPVHDKVTPATAPSAGAGAISEGELRAKAMELARREAELEQRELEVANREDDVVTHVTKKNWPKCYPLVDHSYADIPTVQRKIVAWVGYVLWFVFSLVLVFNFLTSILTLVAPCKNCGSRDLFSNIWFIVFAALILVMGIPCHFVISYWPLYKAMRHGNVPRYCIFFVGYALPILFCIFAIGGWYNYGVGGIVAVIQYWPTVAGDSDSPSYLGFAPNLILAFAWGFLGISFAIVFIVVVLLFRRQKHTLKDVQKLASDSTRDAVHAVTSRLGQAAVQGLVTQQGSTNSV